MKSITFRPMGSIRIIAFCSLLILCKLSSAQISINSLIPGNFTLRPNDLLSLSIVNTQATGFDIYLTGILKSSGNDIVINFRTASFNVKPGNNIISSNILEADFEYNTTAKRFNINKTSLLPLGKYYIEISAYNAQSIEQVSVYDYDYEVTPLSPPLLISPEDEGTLEHTLPLLIWSPALPIDKRLNVVYSLRIVEILANQTSGDAIQRNFPVFEQAGIRQTSLQYPANALKLLPLKNYAWQVQAGTADFFIGSSEIFSFQVKQPENENEERPLYATLLKDPGAGIYLSQNRKVYFNFKEDYNGKALNFKLLNEKGTDVSGTCDLKIIKLQGENQFVLDLTLCSSIRPSFYILEVMSEKNEIYRLKFEVEK